MPHQLLEALGAARRAVDDYVATRRRQGATWDEETATQLLCMAAYPRIEAVEFNHHEERVTGADWLWWWVDSCDECFGMLAQAKKLHHRGQERWFIDFRYPGSTCRQMTSLFRTADDLEVAAAYVLYAGDAEYRAGLACGTDHATSGPCPQCERASVSVLAALAARGVVRWSALSYPGRSALDAFQCSSPIEDLADPAHSPALIHDLNLRYVSPEVRRFLVEPQSGARQVAKMILSQLSELRVGQFAAVTIDRTPVTGTAVFDELPDDVGHFGIPYFPHTLRGLRSRLPDYVPEVLQGARPQWLLDRVAGVVIVHL